MANRDYPLAPTFKPGPGKPKKTPVNFDPSSGIKKPKKTAVKKELTPEEMGVISRSQRNQSILEGFRAKGVSDYNMKGIVEKARLSRDSSNAIMRNARGPAKKSM